jgi:hypothetical protein
MTANVTYIVGIVLTVGSAASLLLMWFSDWREHCYSRREITRFPMFSARDRLVYLVASGEMSEADHPWKWSYRSVTTILRRHQKWHLLGLVLTYAWYVAKLSSNPAKRKMVEEMNLQMKASCQSHPDFARVQEQIGDAFRDMVRARTNVCHMAAIWLLIGGLAIVSSILHFSVATAPAVLKAFRNPSPVDLAGYAASRA